MVSHIVTQPSSNTGSRRVKNSGSFHWLFGSREEPEPEPEPDASAQWVVEQVRAEIRKGVNYLAAQKRVAASPTDLDGSRPAYLLRHIGMLAFDGEIDPELTFRGAVERLQSAWDLLNERADEQETAERRAAEAMAAGRRAVQVFTDAASVEAEIKRVTGEAVELDIDVPGIGKGLAALHVNAHRPQDETMQFPDGLYTPGMPNPRADPFARVEVTQVLAHPHPWDGMVRSDGSTAPPAPVPAAESQPAIPAEPSPALPPLPRRRKVTSFPADMSADPGKPLDGARHEAADLAVMPGAWLLTEGNIWSLVALATLDAQAGSVTVELAEGPELAPLPRDETVWLLPADVASRLASAYRAQSAAMEASR